MTVTITHAKVSGKAAGNDATRVYGTHWDEAHVVPVATTAEAEAGALDTVLMTPVKTKALIDANVPAGAQPLDSDLTAISALATTSYGRDFLTFADESAFKSAVNLEAGTDFLSPAAVAAAYQPLDVELTAVAGLTSAADSLPYFTGIGTASLATFTGAARDLLDDADASTMRATLGLAIGSNVQAYDAQLADIAGITFAQGDVLYFNGSNLVALAPGSAGQYLMTAGAAANPSWETVSGAGVGDVSAASNFGTDNRLIRSDGTTKGVQSSAISVDDSGNVSGVGTVGSGAITSSGTVTAGAFLPTSGSVPTNGMFLGTTNVLGFAANSTSTFLIGQAGVSVGSINGESLFAVNKGFPTATANGYGFRFTSTIPSSTTGFVVVSQSAPSTAASSFTLGTLWHYLAQQGTIGSGSAITTQYGFAASSNLTSATTNYGFHSNIAAASGRWNFYANGTARNWFAGNVGLATTAYFNWSTTDGSSGYGLRNNSGVVEVKHSGGAWRRVNRINVQDYGALGDDSTDNATPFSNAYSALVSAGGGELFIPAGTYRTASFPSVSANNIIIVGEGDASVIRHTATTGNLITISGQYCGVKNVRFHPTVRKTANYEIAFSGAFKGFVRDVTIQYAYNGISISDSASTQVESTTLLYLLGVNGIFYGGSTGSYTGELSKVVANNAYPQAYGTVKTWATSTAYTLNDIIAVNGRIYQCSTAGTSSGTPGGPSGLGSGTTPDSAFTATITDGTAAWKFVSQDTLTWVLQDSYGYSLTAYHLATINGAYGYRMTDSANTGSSYPSYGFMTDLETDHTFYDAVTLERGYSMNFSLCYLGSALLGHGINVGGNFLGEVSISQSRIFANHYNGVLINDGPENIIIGNCQIAANSQASSAAYHGVAIGADASHVTIANCRIGGVANGIVSNPQGYGVLINSGTGDWLRIQNNNLQGNVTGAISNNASGGNNSVQSS